MDPVRTLFQMALASPATIPSFLLFLYILDSVSFFIRPWTARTRGNFAVIVHRQRTPFQSARRYLIFRTSVHGFWETTYTGLRGSLGTAAPPLIPLTSPRCQELRLANVAQCIIRSFNCFNRASMLFCLKCSCLIRQVACFAKL